MYGIVPDVYTLFDMSYYLGAKQCIEKYAQEAVKHLWSLQVRELRSQALRSERVNAIVII